MNNQQPTLMFRWTIKVQYVEPDGDHTTRVLWGSSALPMTRADIEGVFRQRDIPLDATVLGFTCRPAADN